MFDLPSSNKVDNPIEIDDDDDIDNDAHDTNKITERFETVELEEVEVLPSTTDVEQNRAAYKLPQCYCCR